MLVEHGDTCLLVDCGFSLVETERRLAMLGRQVSDIDAVLVTHEHSDHIKGVKALARKYPLQVYMTPGTHRRSTLQEMDGLELINIHQSFVIDEIEVLPVPVPHDAGEPSQFVFSAGAHKLGLLTDLGSISSHVISEYQQCDALLLESNHDVDMLANGPYPASLKRRVAGDWGHLSNRQAADFLMNNGFERLKQLVVAHISETNNTVSCVQELLSEFSEQLDLVCYARQDSGFDWIEIIN